MPLRFDAADVFRKWRIHSRHQTCAPSLERGHLLNVQAGDPPLPKVFNTGNRDLAEVGDIVLDRRSIRGNGKSLRYPGHG